MRKRPIATERRIAERVTGIIERLVRAAFECLPRDEANKLAGRLIVLLHRLRDEVRASASIGTRCEQHR